MSRLVASSPPLTSRFELLHGVQSGVSESALDTTIAEIVAAAAAWYSGQMMLERYRLVNPLLDVRLALCE